jgi:replication factor A1
VLRQHQCGKLAQVQDWTVITRKTGEETRKRSVVLRDSSNAAIEVTLWGNFVDDPGAALEQVSVRVLYVF